MSTTTHEFQPEEVMAFLDGELSAARAAVVAEHVKTCSDCGALAADFRQVSQQLSVWRTEPCPSPIEDRVNAAAAEHLADQTFPRRGICTRRWLGVRVWVWQLAAGSTLGVLLIAVGTLVRAPMGSLSEADLRRSTRRGQASTFISIPQGTKPSNDKVESRPLEKSRAHTQQAAPPSGGESIVGAKLGGVREAEHVGQGPMIARMAELKLVIEKLDAARVEMERILKAHGGYAGQLSASTESGSARSLNATLRVPATQLDATLAELKKLGRVVEESQRGDEVTQQYVDLTARLSNARATEKRLVEVLQTRTGKVHDVLEVEKEIARVREEIERMDAERKSMENRVQFASLTLTLTEEYNAQLNLAPVSTAGRLRNAVVEGYRDVTETALGIVLFFLQYGPSLLLWTAILFWPARLVWRRVRAAAHS